MTIPESIRAWGFIAPSTDLETGQFLRGTFDPLRPLWGFWDFGIRRRQRTLSTYKQGDQLNLTFHEKPVDSSGELESLHSSFRYI